MRLSLICLSFILIACNTRPGEPPGADTVVQTNYNKISHVDTVVHDSSDIYQKIIPKAVLLSINKIPGWGLPKPVAFEPVFYNNYKSDSTLINFLAADFNCDSKQDYALILENKNKDHGAWVLLADKDDYKAIKLNQIRNTYKYINLGLELIAKGDSITDIGLIGTPKSKTINLKCTALHVLYLETSSEAYFWEKNKFNSIFITD